MERFPSTFYISLYLSKRNSCLHHSCLVISFFLNVSVLLFSLEPKYFYNMRSNLFYLCIQLYLVRFLWLCLSRDLPPPGMLLLPDGHVGTVLLYVASVCASVCGLMCYMFLVLLFIPWWGIPVLTFLCAYHSEFPDRVLTCFSDFRFHLHCFAVAYLLRTFQCPALLHPFLVPEQQVETWCPPPETLFHYSLTLFRKNRLYHFGGHKMTPLLNELILASFGKVFLYYSLNK